MSSTTLAGMARAASTERKRRAYAPRVPIEERRQQLLDATLRIIARDGYRGVTIEAIAHEADVTKPVVYGAYDKLPHLLSELLDRTQSQALAQLLEALAIESEPGSVDTRAPQVTRAWARAVRSNPTTWAPILMTGANTPQAVLDRIEASREIVRDQIAQLLITYMGSSAAAKAKVALAAQAIVAAAEHFGRVLLTSPDAIDDDVLADLFDDLTRSVARH